LVMEISEAIVQIRWSPDPFRSVVASAMVG
jgi:hypothetical protein